MRHISSFLLLFFLALNPIIGQEDDTQNFRLAQQYYRSGEYEKASVIYQKLSDKNPTNDYFFNSYVECLLSLEEYEVCEKKISKRIKKNPHLIQLYVSFGNLYERQYKLKEAEAQYSKAIKKLTFTYIQCLSGNRDFLCSSFSIK